MPGTQSNVAVSFVSFSSHYIILFHGKQVSYSFQALWFIRYCQDIASIPFHKQLLEHLRDVFNARLD